MCNLKESDFSKLPLGENRNSEKVRWLWNWTCSQNKSEAECVYRTDIATWLKILIQCWKPSGKLHDLVIDSFFISEGQNAIKVPSLSLENNVVTSSLHPCDVFIRWMAGGHIPEADLLFTTRKHWSQYCNYRKQIPMFCFFCYYNKIHISVDFYPL